MIVCLVRYVPVIVDSFHLNFFLSLAIQIPIISIYFVVFPLSNNRIQRVIMKRIFVILFFSLFLISKPALSEIVPGEIVFHPADVEIVYNWYSYVPTGIEKNQAIFIMINCDVGGAYWDYDAITEDAKTYAGHKSVRAEQYNYVLLQPAIPRAFDPNWNNTEVYSAAFDKRVFSDVTNPFLKRPDLKVNLMIDRLKGLLRAEGYQVKDRVMFEGFSLGGMFAQRYALLHPERVQAVSAGHCGGTLILPRSTHNETVMNWPVGVSNFESLVGQPFNEEVYKQIPQYIYVGDHDDNTMVKRVWGTFYTDDEVVFLINTFGYGPPSTLKNQSEYLQLLGYNIQFKLYPNVSTGPGTHGTYCEGSVEDAYAFLAANQGNVVDVRRFVTRFYQQCLSREPDSSGLNGWSNALLNGTLTGADVAFSFIFSDEFINRYTTNEDFVTILYRAFFNREPDSAGYSGWLNAL